MLKNILKRVGLLSVFLFVLSACGQQGPLYLPEKNADSETSSSN